MTNLRIPDYTKGVFSVYDIYDILDDDPIYLNDTIKSYKPNKSIKASLRSDWINIAKDFRKAYNKVVAKYKQA